MRRKKTDVWMSSTLFSSLDESYFCRLLKIIFMLIKRILLLEAKKLVLAE